MFFSHRNSFNEEADLLTLLHKGSVPTTWGHHGNHFFFCLSSVAFQVRNFKVTQLSVISVFFCAKCNVSLTVTHIVVWIILWIWNCGGDPKDHWTHLPLCELLWPVNKSLLPLPPCDSWRLHECDSSHLKKNGQDGIVGWLKVPEPAAVRGWLFQFFKLIYSSFKPSVLQNVNIWIKTSVSFSILEQKPQPEALHSPLLPAPRHFTLGTVFGDFQFEKGHISIYVWIGNWYWTNNAHLSLIKQPLSFIFKY